VLVRGGIPRRDCVAKPLFCCLAEQPTVEDHGKTAEGVAGAVTSGIFAW